MLQTYNKIEWKHHKLLFLLRSFMDSNIDPDNYVLKISRKDVLSESLKKIV